MFGRAHGDALYLICPCLENKYALKKDKKVTDIPVHMFAQKFSFPICLVALRVSETLCVMRKFTICTLR